MKEINKHNRLIYNNKARISGFKLFKGKWCFEIDNGSLFEQTKDNTIISEAFKPLLWLAANIKGDWCWSDGDNDSNLVIVDDEVCDVRNIIYVAIVSKTDAAYFKLSNSNVKQINKQNMVF